MSETREEGLSALLHETRTFPPPEEFAKQANAQPGIYAEAEADPLAFWASQAKRLTWDTPWTEVLEWKLPFAKWFVGGKLNVAVNCVDRHVDAGLGDRVAFHWEGEPGDTRTITYDDLLTLVSQAANGLTELGVRAGDKVAIYMPMIPETVVAMLACARLGAPHTVVFGGFSADALRGRILDCDAHFVITADGGYRRGAAAALKPAVDEAVLECPDVEPCPGRAAHRPGGGVGRGPRRLVARPGAAPARDARGRGLRRRAPALHHVHQRHDGQAQGHPAHQRRATSPMSRPPTGSSSTSSPRPTSSGRRPTSAGSPGTATSSTGPWPTARPRSCTRARPTRPPATAGGRSSRSTRSTSSTPRRPPSGPS